MTDLIGDIQILSEVDLDSGLPKFTFIATGVSENVEQIQIELDTEFPRMVGERYDSRFVYYGDGFSLRNDLTDDPSTYIRSIFVDEHALDASVSIENIDLIQGGRIIESLSRLELENFDFENSFEITGNNNEDSDAPTLSAFDITIVQQDSGLLKVVFAGQAFDDSGVNQIHVELEDGVLARWNTSGNESIKDHFAVYLDSKGDEISGFERAMYLASDVSHARYEVDNIELWDIVGNSQIYPKAELAKLGFDTSFLIDENSFGQTGQIVIHQNDLEITSSGSASEGLKPSISFTSAITDDISLIREMWSDLNEKPYDTPEIVGGTAEEGVDFTIRQIDYSVSINPRFTVRLNLLEDDLIEGDETIIFEWEGLSHTFVINDETMQQEPEISNTEELDVVDESLAPSDASELTLIANVFGSIMFLDGLTETVTSTSHTIEYNGTTFDYAEVDGIITTVVRDGEFTSEFAAEIAESFPDHAGISYSTAVALIGQANMESTLLAVAGADGNYVG